MLALLSLTALIGLSCSATSSNTSILRPSTLLGTDLVVSEFCLSAMTFGVHNYRLEVFTNGMRSML